MKTSTIIPAIVLGAASLVMSAGSFAGNNMHTVKHVDPVTGAVSYTESAVSDVGNAGLGLVGGVVNGTGQVITGVFGGTEKAVSGSWMNHQRTQVHHTHHHVYHHVHHVNHVNHGKKMHQ